MFTSILIPTDGSEKAVIAASKAVELAKEQGAKLTAVVVIDPFPYIGLGEASAFGLQAYLSEAQAMATQSLDGVRAMAEAAGVPFMAETIERSAVFEGILGSSRDDDVWVDGINHHIANREVFDTIIHESPGFTAIFRLHHPHSR